jgi:BirA family biotin operon repressor/biotin-[acetyl-CoA-carboxylase] ligase
VAGVGLNVELPESHNVGLDSEWAQRATDLRQRVEVLPAKESLAASVVDEIAKTLADFERSGFACFAERWPSIDWLLGKDVLVEDEQRTIKGMAAGVDTDGALLVRIDNGQRCRVISGSIRLAGA